MKVLGIETSCDETAVAIYDDVQGLLAHTVYSQIDLHAQYGGVVPELASRDHIRKIIPLVQQVLDESNLLPEELDGIGYTSGPGLIGALMVGAGVAQALSLAWQLPIVTVHHMEGHLLAPMLEEKKPQFPFVALLVSGGHTLMVDVKQMGDYTALGESIDDAVGEAFDKTAKILGLPYPGGPSLSKLAEQGRDKIFHFSRPMTNRPGLDFSFSGLKTAALQAWQKSDQTEQTKADIARAFQEAAVDTLVIKCKRAIEATGRKTLVIAGGVSANHYLRERLAEFEKEKGVNVFFPSPAFCTDNAAMIAYTACIRLKAGQHHDQTIEVRSRWPLEELMPILGEENE